MRAACCRRLHASLATLHASLTCRDRFWKLTATPSLSAWTDWLGRLMTADLKLTSVSFCAFLSFLPTLALTRLKSTPTPAFFFLLAERLAQPPTLRLGRPMLGRLLLLAASLLALQRRASDCQLR